MFINAILFMLPAEGVSMLPSTLVSPPSSQISELYFDFLIDQTALPLSINERLFDNINPGSQSGFFVTPSDPASPYYCGGATFFIPINQSNIF